MTDTSSNATTALVDVARSDQMNVVKKLVWEYFRWGNGKAVAEYGFDFDIAGMLDDFVAERAAYNPPDGRLYLVRCNEIPAALGGFKRMDETSCELKRLFVREPFRGRGLGRNLLDTLIDDARRAGLSGHAAGNRSFHASGAFSVPRPWVRRDSVVSGRGVA